MVTIKNHTNLPQSKKLAEFLPLESADMCYGVDDDTLKYNDLPWLIPYHKYTAKEYYVPCWSLVALLDILQHPVIARCDDKKWRCTVWIATKTIPYLISYNDELITACYEMVLMLHEQKLL